MTPQEAEYTNGDLTLAQVDFCPSVSGELKLQGIKLSAGPDLKIDTIVLYQFARRDVMSLFAAQPLGSLFCNSSLMISG